MTTSSWTRSRCITAAMSVLTVIAVAAGVAVLALGVGLPDAWWPHTGHAFAAGSHPAHHDHCASVVGRAQVYCERGTTASGRQSTTGAAWGLVSALAGGSALVVWRLRRAGQRRR
jgi:hypothetical protein